MKHLTIKLNNGQVIDYDMNDISSLEVTDVNDTIEGIIDLTVKKGMKLDDLVLRNTECATENDLTVDTTIGSAQVVIDDIVSTKPELNDSASSVIGTILSSRPANTAVEHVSVKATEQYNVITPRKVQ